jgi:hypothetical protein
MKTITFQVDEDDFDAIQNAVAKRQTIPLPDSDGDKLGRVIAEICRGWYERVEAQGGKDDKSGEEWKNDNS